MGNMPRIKKRIHSVTLRVDDGALQALQSIGYPLTQKPQNELSLTEQMAVMLISALVQKKPVIELFSKQQEIRT